MLARALDTPGWMLPEELRWLQKKAKQHRRVVEVGSYLGRSTLALAEHAEFVLAIDDWKGPRDVALSARERRLCYRRFLRNMSDYVKKGRVIPYRTDYACLAVSKLPRQPPFDLVFIDGDHRWGAVVRDIRFWMKLLADDGVLCGHDLHFPEVARAVCHLLGRARVGVAPDTTIWWSGKRNLNESANQGQRRRLCLER